MPELVLGSVPAGTHVLVLTHDHAEDFALCDAALRCSHLGSIGLIGSAAKWARFRQGLRVEGHRRGGDRPDHHAHRAVGRRRPALVGKEPAVIALAVAASLVASFAPSVEAARTAR